MPGNLSVQWLVLLGILKQLGKRVCVFVRCLQLLYLVVYFCGKGPSETAVQITKECRTEAVIYSTSSHILYWFHWFCTRQVIALQKFALVDVLVPIVWQYAQ